MAQELPDLRALRYFIAVADAGSFTEAALDLHVSQASVSRTVAGLEEHLHGRLLRRLPRGAELTHLGHRLLPDARKMLQQGERMLAIARDERQILRLGHAWSAVGRFTTPLLRAWRETITDTELRLVRFNTPSGGLLEGMADAAILRLPVQDTRIETVPVGSERRYVAFASDDAEWGRRRSLKLAELTGRTILVDERTGTTDARLWPQNDLRTLSTPGVDEWLDGIAAGDGIGVTAEATMHHNPRPGVSYRLIGDAPKIEVRAGWWADDPPERIHELVALLRGLYSEKKRGGVTSASAVLLNK